MRKFANRYLLILGINFLLFSYFVHSIHANTVVFSDDFNDSNASGWEEHSPWGGWTATDSAYIGNAKYIMSPALPSYALNGDQNWTDYNFDIDLLGVQGIDKQVLFHVNKLQNRAYIFNFRSSYFSGGNDALLAKRSPLGSENATLLQAVNFINFPNTLYHLNIQVTTLTDTAVGIKIYINQQKIIDYVDTSNPILNGSIGLEVVPGGYLPNPNGLITSTKYDNILVTILSNKLPVPNIKQYSKLWGSLEYDNAHIWSPLKNTISRYGCALTSTTMILQSYGYTVTPDVLNTWLINNNGYIGDGLLDWSAVTKWVKINHDINPLLTKLEYSRNKFDTNFLTNEIENKRPAIVKLVRPDFGTHFIVVTGREEADFDMNDPATTNTLLSYYPSTQYSRIDSFKPSQTDLSYLYFYTSPNVNFTAMDPNGNIITDLTEFEGPYIDQVDQTNSSQRSLRVFALAKPINGDYLFRMNGTGSYVSETRIYSTDGMLNRNQYTGNISTGQVKTYLVRIGGNNSTNLIDFSFIRQNLTEAYKNNLIKSKLVYNTLLLLLNTAEKANVKDKTRPAVKILETMKLEIKLANKLIDKTYAAKILKFINYLEESI